jgi:hypothetical protein
MQTVDAETGEVVDADEIVKGYKAGDSYTEITDEDLEAIEVESTRTINVDQFVPRAEIDDLYIDRPYYIVPGEVGQQAFGAAPPDWPRTCIRLMFDSRPTRFCFDERFLTLTPPVRRPGIRIRSGPDASGDLVRISGRWRFGGGPFSGLEECGEPSQLLH